jgi:hypothetical protein
VGSVLGFAEVIRGLTKLTFYVNKLFGLHFCSDYDRFRNRIRFL